MHSGVDLEPDSSQDPNDPLRLSNITFRECRALNNSGNGFGGYLLNVNFAGKRPVLQKYPLTITFDNCSIVGGNGGWSFGTIMPGGLAFCLWYYCTCTVFT